MLGGRKMKDWGLTVLSTVLSCGIVCGNNQRFISDSYLIQQWSHGSLASSSWKKKKNISTKISNNKFNILTILHVPFICCFTFYSVFNPFIQKSCQKKNVQSSNPDSPSQRRTWLPSRCWPSLPSPPASFASGGPSRRRCSWRRRTPAGPGRPWRSSPSGTCRWPWRRGSWAASLASGCW